MLINETVNPELITTVYYSFLIRICDLVILIGEHNIYHKKITDPLEINPSVRSFLNVIALNQSLTFNHHISRYTISI